MMDNNFDIESAISQYREGVFDQERAYARSKTANKKDAGFQATWAILLSAIAVIVLALVIFKPIFPWNESEYFAATEKVTVTLPDSSSIVLSPKAALTYRKRDFRRGKRSITISGTVFCRISRNEIHPFSVLTSNAEILVLGTEFQIDADSAGTTVDVISGKVSFGSPQTEPQERSILEKGMRSTLSAGEEFPIPLAKKSLNPAAWATGVFCYDNTPLKNVLEDLSYYYNTSLISNDSDKVITAEFKTDDLDEIIFLIEDALGIKILKN